MLEELSNIIKETDFIWEGNKPEICLKIIPNINCRGVKSSMKDPIKVIQIVLDKYIVTYYIILKLCSLDCIAIFRRD